MSNAEHSIARYLTRHGVALPPWVTLAPPDKRLRICVVIPAYDELQRIESVISSLHTEELPNRAVEIIVCVNNADDSPPRAIEANGQTLKRLHELETPFELHVIDRSSKGRAFPAGQAGVGRARRLLMDLATRRLHQARRSADGIIACLDGDSPAAPGYLDTIWREMVSMPNALAGVCRYRHPIPEEKSHAQAMIAYEVWMRFFELALHLTRTPYAFQSIGSCMVVSARGYARADGVPPREALSDFYLLQKIVKSAGRGSVRQLRGPLVRPSARPSTRVPRGTGPSVRASMHHGDDRFIWVEPPRAFMELRAFFDAIEPGFEEPDALRQSASPFLKEILDRWNGWQTIDKLRRHAPDASRFERQFHTWFDSLKVVKFANRSKEKWGGVFIFDAVRELFEALGDELGRQELPDATASRVEHGHWLQLLDVMRRLELLDRFDFNDDLTSNRLTPPEEALTE